MDIIWLLTYYRHERRRAGFAGERNIVKYIKENYDIYDEAIEAYYKIKKKKNVDLLKMYECKLIKAEE